MSSSMYLTVISLGFNKIWLRLLIASQGCRCNLKLIKQNNISCNGIDLWDIILNKIDLCNFSANTTNWFIWLFSASSKWKSYYFYDQLCGCHLFVWGNFTFLMRNCLDMSSVVLFGACIEGVVLRDKYVYPWLTGKCTDYYSYFVLSD